ncbi:MAG: permease-like cell division protein FtsX [Candidatus Moranbacteria bacterium]|nr:permease-like cell division protein FtsX [Candidatus Moranbacteria bacterium]
MKRTKLLKLWRTFKEGLKNFYRNGWLSFATVSILTISLYILSITILVGISTDSILKSVEDKINVSIYFNPEVKEERILEIKDKLTGYREIKSIDYVSKDQALKEFLASGNNDPSITQALEEIGENPLLAALVIRAHQSEQYGIIAQAIEQSNFREEISRINYEKNRTAIERLNNLIRLAERVGFVLGSIFIIIAVLITFNTIRLTIYSHRQEFEIMRLVGASNMYVRMPYVFEGILYGLFSAVGALLLLFITVAFTDPIIQKIMAGASVESLYFQYFGLIALFLFASGIILGIVSGFIAIRRYLKV